MKATHVYHNGTILTFDSRCSIVSAMAVSDEVILAVGNMDEIRIFTSENTQYIDLKGQCMLPGFYDAHSHFMRAGMYEKYYLSIHTGVLGAVKSINDAKKKIKHALEELPKGDWLLCHGYDDTGMADNRHITLVELDEISPDNPIFIRHISGHLAVCNSKAFSAAKITASTANPSGGVICKDSDGNLTGLLEEPSAMELVLNVSPEITEEKWFASIKHSNKAYLSKGVTTAHEGGVTTEMWETYMKAHALNLLDVRVQILPRHTSFDFNLPPHSKSGTPFSEDEMLSLGAVKIFQDGSIQGYTGYLSNPYHSVINPIIQDPDAWRGYPIYDRNTFIEKVVHFHRAGWQIAVHGNGDNGIEDIIDAFEAAQKAYPRHDARHIIIHCQMVREDQLDRMKELGIFPSFFVTHTYYWGDRHRDILLGEDRAMRINPLKSALKRDMLFTNHCDTPVTPINPLLCVWSAVNRITSSGKILGEAQRINVLDALKSITIWAAYQFNEEKRKGSLEPGKLADMVVLGENPLIIDSIKLRDISIIATIVGNKVRYGTLE